MSSVPIDVAGTRTIFRVQIVRIRSIAPAATSIEQIREASDPAFAGLVSNPNKGNLIRTTDIGARGLAPHGSAGRDWGRLLSQAFTLGASAAF